MLFECWLQLRGEAPPERQIDSDKTLGLTHNLGGQPGACVCSYPLSDPKSDSYKRHTTSMIVHSGHVMDDRARYKWDVSIRLLAVV